MEEWFVLFTKPRAEFKAELALRSRGIEVFLPVAPSPESRRKDRREPLFPRYLFAQADLAEIAPDALHWTPGLVRPLFAGDSYVRISPEAIDLIRGRLSEIEGQGGLPPHDFQPGDRVHISAGPLQGLDGVFDGPRTPRERVTILVHFLNRTNKVEIDVALLEPTKSPGGARPPRRTRGRGRRIKGHPGTERNDS